jgi:hypothetical protein
MRLLSGDTAEQWLRNFVYCLCFCFMDVRNDDIDFYVSVTFLAKDCKFNMILWCRMVYFTPVVKQINIV